MCDQCNAKVTFFGEPMPGWYLMRATRDGIVWKAGEWGLVSGDDPDFRWSSTPTPSVLFGVHDDSEQERWLQANEGTPQYERELSGPPADFSAALLTEPGRGYRLVVAAMQRGYDPEESGDFASWLFDLLGEHLKDVPSKGMPRERMTDARP